MVKVEAKSLKRGTILRCN